PTAVSAKPTLAIALMPAAVVLGLVVLPHVKLGPAPAALVVFAIGAVFMVVSLALAAPSAPPLRLAIAVGGAAVVPPLGIAFAPASRWLAPAVDASLVAVGHALGASLGRRVQHPGHLLPACIVAACADVASVVHPSGPTHAIAASERALSILAINVPVPGV